MTATPAVQCRTGAAGRLAAPSVAGQSWTALGTFCSLLVTSPALLRPARQLLAAQLAAIDLACSRFRADSELSALNRAAGRAVTVSPLLAGALSAALTAAVVSDGDVDPTCGRSLAQLGYDRDFAQVTTDTSALPEPAVKAPGWHCVRLDSRRRTVRVPAGVMLDLGATAKAYAADRAACSIAAALGCGTLVNLGGDIAVAGPAPRGGWRVRVAGPGGGPVVAIEAGGIATSSTAARSWRRGGRRLHHILVPGTGQPADGCWVTVTVAAANCVDANTASTASIVRGEPARGWLSRLGLPARLVRADGTQARTGGWPG